jgi:DNA-binding IclR family transcriptional regulator
MSPAQVAKALGKNTNTTYNLLRRMVQDGDIKLARHGKYIPVEGVEGVEASSIKKDKRV